jgi:uncharacterized protein
MVSFNSDVSSSVRIIWGRSKRITEQDCACAADLPSIKVEEDLMPKEVETDCACAEPVPVSINSPTPPAALWQRASDLYRAPLPDRHTLFFNPQGSAGVVVLDELAAQILDAFPRPVTAATASRSLGELPLDTVRVTAGSLQRLGLLRYAASSSFCPDVLPQTLTAWLHVTARCNLACPYCYAHRNRRSMSPEIGRAAVEAVFRSAQANGFRAVKFKYAGGEPTLNFPVVEEIHRCAQRAAKETGIALKSVLLSNGIALTDRMLEWMIESDVRLMISLDGIGEVHDRQRSRPGGEGSFLQVSSAIDRARSMGLRPHLSTTITSHNVAHLADVAAFALERDLLFNLNFVRPTPGSPELAPSSEQLISGVGAALDVIESRLPSYRLIDGLLDRCITGVPHAYTCGVGRSYLVIGPSGQLARCHMELDEPVGSIWDPTPLTIVRNRAPGLRNAPVDSKEGCRDCQWRYICAGGCPLTSLGGRSPYCAVYRVFLPKLLRLEGRRLKRRLS